ncbi:lipid-A-disaccharide synthase [Candidatus Hydrogenosomobacter endosymbioticus]|uniref:Lipid-A-disaccharide synthase n=1 Tax=Candidatus Hydrogenosomobacter endosymbioticus TaxID=2558174 RepID=A0ABM7V8D2_9PROT|nr:lipid-A-disaccharide synthase [Candidatus Hydrogenosomobacter endosymbioticus]BDB96031.1 lipid-A-disaccharide synthase [Candidatus Hydrogenosomobacter endosymbioticus]
MPKFFVIAGEASGDMIGADVICGLLEEFSSKIEIIGVGGPMMERAGGFCSMFPFSQISHMGIGEVVRRLPRIIKLINACVKEIERVRPDAIITIDSPEFCFRVNKRVKGKFPIIHCVAPAVWAWRRGRAKKIHKYADHILSVFPFEAPYFAKSKISVSFVGHPAVQNFHNLEGDCFLQKDEAALLKAERRKKLMDELKISGDERILCVLPGSRRYEVYNFLPIFSEAARIVQNNAKTKVFPVIVATKQWPGATDRYSGGYPVVLDADMKRAVFENSAVAIAASGTVGLELAAHGVPMVVGYKAPKITELILRFILKTEWISLVNISAGRRIVKEFLQNEFTEHNISEEILLLLEDEDYAKAQKDELSRVAESFGHSLSFKKACAQEIARISGFLS